jgi:hydrogenase 3 maturation protease
MEMRVMPSPTWKTQASRALSSLTDEERQPRVALMGVGNDLRGDDGAGLALARALGEHLPADADDRLLVVEAGQAPENFSGALRRFRPDLVVLLDAAHLGEEPGAVRWLAASVAGGMSASTHTLPLHMLAAYLEAELGCEVALLGIQPADISFGGPISPPVREAVEALAGALPAILGAA